MKRVIGILLVIGIMICGILGSAEGVETAADFGGQCVFSGSRSGNKTSNMTDGKMNTAWNTNPGAMPYIDITAPVKLKICGVYVKFGDSVPEETLVQKKSGEDWVTVGVLPPFKHAYIAVDGGCDVLRLQDTSDNAKEVLSIAEISVFTRGQVPDWVQVWHRAENADCLFFSLRPMDETTVYGKAVSYMGQNYETVVACMGAKNSIDQSSLLDSLYKMGISAYPYFGDWKKASATSIDEAYKIYGGKDSINAEISGVVNQFNPKCLFAPGGEKTDGSFVHGMLSSAVTDAVRGDIPLLVHDVNGEIVGNGDYSSAEAAFQCYKHEKTDPSFDELSEKFGNGKFTNTEIITSITSSKAENSPLPQINSVEEEKAYVKHLPQLNEAGFCESQFVYDNDEEGVWIFGDPTCLVTITRERDDVTNLVWFECNIWSDVDKGVMLKTYWNDEEKRMKVSADASKTAQKNNLAFAINTDYFTYRMNSKNVKVGVDIRNGEILFDDPYKERTANFPNLDTVAFHKDGTLTVSDGYGKSAQSYIDEGAETVLSFGPWLIKDGEFNPWVNNRKPTLNPRCAIGQVERGHVVYVMCEGRLKDSSGVSLQLLRLMMKNLNCTQAFNLDGGQTCVVEFMGRQLNRIGKYDGKTNARPTCEVMGIGKIE